MNVKQTKFTLKYLPARISVLLRSRHGLGKSEIIKQICAELSKEFGIPYECIDIRLSQREVGDIIGMPRAVKTFDVSREVYVNGELQTVKEVINDVMIHDLPVWFPRDPDWHGILLLDEIDRASRDVQQAAFELVLDYRLNMRTLPEGCRVVSCINGDQDVYTVLGMCPALLDRFLVIDFKPTVPEWQDHAVAISVHDAILKYIAKIPSDLDTPENITPNQVYQSRRSWVKFSHTLREMGNKGYDCLDKNQKDYLLKLAYGFLGTTVAQNFCEFIANDYKVYSVEEILDKFNREMQTDFAKMLPSEMSFYGKLIVDYLLDGRKKLTKRQEANLSKLYRTVCSESASDFWALFSTKYRDEATRWYTENEEVVQRTISIIGKKSALGLGE